MRGAGSLSAAQLEKEQKKGRRENAEVNNIPCRTRSLARNYIRDRESKRMQRWGKNGVMA
jgi:hypothetical protein